MARASARSLVRSSSVLGEAGGGRVVGRGTDIAGGRVVGRGADLEMSRQYASQAVKRPVVGGRGKLREVAAVVVGGGARSGGRGPDPFAVAVRVALSRLGRRPYELAAAAGEPKDKVYAWLNGGRSVRACTAAKLLAACGLGIVVDPAMAKGLGVAPLSAKAGVGAGVGAGCGSGGAVGAGVGAAGERGAA